MDTLFVINPCGNIIPPLDTAICEGDSVLLIASGSANGYNWVDSLTFTPILATDSFYLASPIATTTYAIYSTTDTAYVTVTVYLSSSSTQNLSECDGYTITINGNTYTITGNYIDTITAGSSNGCDSIVTTNLTINQLPNVGTNNATSLCTLDLSTDLFPLLGGADVGGSWSPSLSSGTGVFNPGIDPGGNYNYVINNAPCPADSSTITVTINPSPTVAITTNDDNCASEEGSIILTNLTGTPPINYSWNTGQTDSILTNLTMGTYTVIVSDSTGCTSTYITTINDLEIDCDYHIYLPNVFSPNGDGENDILYVRGKGVESITLTIYNRWGNKVFETNDMEIGWDGTYHGNDQGSAVFVYFINATFINGQSIEEKGNVSIVK
jgi:gliding motility-associated-like protein